MTLIWFKWNHTIVESRANDCLTKANNGICCNHNYAVYVYYIDVCVYAVSWFALRNGLHTVCNQQQLNQFW